jgi:hypothetical protein
MTAGLPDYWNRNRVDITAQTIAKLSVDIIAQTLAALNVNITAQDLASMVVDIASASIGDLPIDISAASLGDLAIDIAAQTLGDIAINVASQDISEIINRPTYGTAIGAQINNTVEYYSTTTLLEVFGTGVLYGGQLFLSGSVSHQLDGVHVILDYELLQRTNMAAFLTYKNFNGHSSPITLSLYDDINFMYGVLLNPGYTFENNLRVEWGNASAENAIVKGDIFYATI